MRNSIKKSEIGDVLTVVSSGSTFNTQLLVTSVLEEMQKAKALGLTVWLKYSSCVYAL